MKVAILINTLYKGRGMDYVAEQQAKDLINSGNDVTIFTFDYDHEIDDIPIERLDWPKKEILNLIYRIIFPLDILKTMTYSKKLMGYDIIISHFYPMHFLAFLVKKRYSKIKYIFYNHGMATNRYASLSERYYLVLMKILTFFTMSNTDMIISISKFIKCDMKNKNAKNIVIYNRIDTNRFNYNHSTINDSMSNILNEKCPKFLYVGVIGGHKGIELLIKSFKMIIETYPNAKLFLVGKLSYKFNLHRYIDKDDDNIIYLGKVSDYELGFIYNHIDVYLTASMWEGFNLPIIEAQMFSKPVVAFDICSHDEVVQNGETGILVEPFNIVKFADAIVEVYENREDMGQRAKMWGTNFSARNKNYNIAKLIGGLD